MSNESDLPTLPITASADGETDVASYGRYISLGVIGRGGMGVVLRARDPELDRNIAIKMLAPSQFGEHDPSSDQRLQREAQAMAKLIHPNVVHVYDIGRAGGSRFIAMELVEGTTLRRWLLDRTRPWRDVVDMFVGCGRGLEAAHGAGLVHRDFKPENVLIGADQRPRVTDFGLVATGVSFDSGDLDSGSPISGLTIRGAVIGTPMYMSPEQWSGGEVDPRTDQFAFCVAMWEGVYGERPFAGRTSVEVRENVLTGKLRDTPEVRGVPRWLETALRRGLAVDREERWPSMTALLAELDRPRRRRWPWLVAAAGTLALGGVAVVAVMSTSSSSDPCPDPAARLAGVWDKDVAARLRAAFVKVSPGFGADVGDRVTQALDSYSGEWRKGVIAACRATKVENVQSPQLLDARMACLDRRRGELEALTTAFVSADRVRVTRAIELVGSLGALDACADRERLMTSPPPSDPALRARVDEVEAMVVASDAAQYTVRPPDRQAMAAAALAAARETGHVPLIVRALQEMFEAADANTDSETAVPVLRELAQKAAEAQDDVLSAVAWIHLIKMLTQEHRYDEAATLDPVAEAAVARAGSPAGLRFGLLTSRGVRFMYAQKFDESVTAYRAAIDAAVTDGHRAAAHLALAQVLNMRDGPKEALPVIEKGLAATELVFGRDHPRTADALQMLAHFLHDSGDNERAYTTQARALAIREASLEPGNRDIAISLHQLGNIELRRGQSRHARELYERAIPIFEGVRGEKDAALSRAMLGGLVADEDGIEAARPLFEKGLAGLAATFGKDHMQYVYMEANYGQRLIDAKLCAEADPHMAHVAEVMTRVRPRDLPVVLENWGLCDFDVGKVAPAIEKLERARRVCAAHDCEFPEDLDFDLGRILVESRRDRAGGMKLVAQARKLAIEHESKELLVDIDAWLAQRR